MKIELHEIPVRELMKGYQDDGEGGVTGYGGRLDIRPKYQREFVYNPSQRDAVINSIQNNRPLNVMYWAVRADGSYEVIDGQQRTISIARYVDVVDGFPVNDLFFENLPGDRQKQILDYELMVYMCEGTDSDQLDWFKTINIAGEKLTDQELRNAVYAGSWVSDAKRYFSRSNCQAYNIGQDYMNGSPIRQEYLETAILWHKNHGETVEQYMGRHQHDHTAVELWNHFRSVIGWVEATFTRKRKAMKGVDWGKLHNDHKHSNLDPTELETETARLVMDRDVTNKKDIYPYLLTGKEKYLNIRAFDDVMKQWAYENQDGTCISCRERFDLSEMEADHITPWCEGGPTKEENCQMLCRECNRRKSSK